MTPESDTPAAPRAAEAFQDAVRADKQAGKKSVVKSIITAATHGRRVGGMAKLGKKLIR